MGRSVQKALLNMFEDAGTGKANFFHASCSDALSFPDSYLHFVSQMF